MGRLVLAVKAEDVPFTFEMMEEEEIKKIDAPTLRLDREFYKLIRHKIVDKGTNFNALVRSLLKSWLDGELPETDEEREVLSSFRQMPEPRRQKLLELAATGAIPTPGPLSTTETAEAAPKILKRKAKEAKQT
jgi:hypothetical protein